MSSQSMDNNVGDEISSSNKDARSSNGNSMMEEDIAKHEERRQLVQRMLALEFYNVDEADRYYFRYGQLMGFDIRKYSLKTKKVGLRTVLNRVWVCAREGFSEVRPEYDRVRQPRNVKRCGCRARFRVSLDSTSGKYKVTTFVPDHNHPLETPESSHILRCNRLLNQNTKTLLATMTGAGLRPNQVMDFLEELDGENETHVVQRKDAYNFLNMERLKRTEGGDVNTMLGLINGMKVKDNSIEYLHSVDENNALTRIFWCDGISRAEYEKFGDVLIFDSTYKTNKYRLPIVLFSGVSSNCTTCIFGVAIMYKETTQQYTWLLRTFRHFMNGKSPLSILTDQDGAMRAAIADVFPEASHRLCCWHISRNAKANVNIPGFARDFSKLMKARCTEGEFQKEWDELIDKFKVAEHAWVQDIYSKRHLWAAAFFEGKFFGMLRTTSRSESMNALLKRKVRPGHSLTDFFMGYHNGFLKRTRHVFYEKQKESEVPLNSYKQRGLLNDLLKHAGQICTRGIFRCIRDEVKEEQNIIKVRQSEPENARHTFAFEDHGNGGGREFTTVIDLEKLEFQCECKKLESDGIPCRHLICGFKNLKISKFPPKSINPRWLVAVGKELISRFSYKDPKAIKGGVDHGKLIIGVKDAPNAAAVDVVHDYDDVVDDDDDDHGIDHDDDEDDEDGDGAEGDRGIDDDQVNFRHVRNVLDPIRIIPKGGSRSKKQQCGYCRQHGHKTTTCPQKKLEQAGGPSRGKGNTIPLASHESVQDDVSRNVAAEDYFVRPASSTSHFGLPQYHGSHTSLLYNIQRNHLSSQEGASNSNSYQNTSSYMANFGHFRTPM